MRKYVVKLGVMLSAVLLCLMTVGQQTAMAQIDGAQPNVPGVGSLTDPSMDLHLDPEFNDPASAYSQLTSPFDDLNLRFYEPDLGQSNDPNSPLFPGIGNPWPEDNPDGFGFHIGPLPDMTPSEGDTSPLMDGPYLNVYGGANTGFEGGWIFHFDGP